MIYCCSSLSFSITSSCSLKLIRRYININLSQCRASVSSEIIHLHQELQLYLLGSLDRLCQGQGCLVEPGLQTEGGLGQRSHSGLGVDAGHSQAELGGDLLVLRDQTFTSPAEPTNLTLALCIVKRSTPRLSICRLDMRDITLNEMETGFLK